MLPAPVVEALKKRSARQAAERRKAGKAWSGTGYASPALPGALGRTRTCGLLIRGLDRQVVGRSWKFNTRLTFGPAVGPDDELVSGALKEIERLSHSQVREAERLLAQRTAE